VEVQADLPDTLEELRALERQVEREWWWLHGALNAVAQMRAERAGCSLLSFRQMQEQAREVDRRRVEIAVHMAELEARLTNGTWRTSNPG
jgi:hypothetical protein